MRKLKVAHMPTIEARVNLSAVVRAVRAEPDRVVVLDKSGLPMRIETTSC